jgi:hypothetical protein
MKVVAFMSTTFGRSSRVVAGLLLIAVGLLLLDGVVGTAVALFGVLPLMTGLFNICPISPFYGLPLRACPVPVRRDQDSR